MIISKTTNFAFKKYGDSFQNTDSIPQEYTLTKQCIKNKSFDEVYCFDHDVYLSSDSGYSLLVIYDEEKETFIENALHRVCLILKGTYFNLIAISSFANVDFYSLNTPSDCLKPFKEYQYKEVVSRINVTKIIGCYNDFRAKGYYFQGKVLQYYEFTYVFSGNMYITYKDKEIKISKGQSIVFEPGDIHSKLINDKSCSFFTVVFEMDVDEKNRELLTRKVFNIPFVKDLNLNFLSQKTRSVYDDSLMITTIQLIVITLLKYQHIKNFDSSINNESLLSNEIIDEILTYISTEYKNIESVENLCEKFFFSRSSMQKLFNEHLGVSPKKYLVKYKIDRAREVLETGSIPVNEVAKMVGFNDQHYFSRAFKKETGMSPTQLKKEIELHHI